MSTSKSGIAIIDPEDYRPPMEFRDGDVAVTSFGGNLVAVGSLETDGEIVAEVDGKETLRYARQAGKFEIRRSEFIPDAIWQARSSPLQLRICTVEAGVATCQRLMRFTNDYHNEYQAWRKQDDARRRQNELLSTHRGVNEVISALVRIAQNGEGKRSYAGSGDVTRGLGRLACEFLAVDSYTKLEQRQVLEVFLEDDAIELATQLPNEYWFATCLKAAFTQGNTFARASRVKLEEAIRSVATPIRERIAERSGNSTELRSALNAIEGVVLVGESGLFDNPVFEQ